MLVWSISRGSDVVSGELGRGTLEMLLARPISRLKLLFAHSLLSVAGVGLLTFLVWLGLYAGIHTNSVRETIHTGASIELPFFNWQIPVVPGRDETVFVPLSQRVDARTFVSPCLNLFAFCLFMLGLSTLLSALDRYRWRTIGVVVSFYVIELLILLLAKATPSMAWCHALTFFTFYQPDGIVHLMSGDPAAAWALTYPHSKFWYTDLGPLGISLALIAMACVCFVAAGWWFQRRDLPAPV
jgi:ABC-2 type transport system permease protein